MLRTDETMDDIAGAARYADAVRERTGRGVRDWET